MRDEQMERISPVRGMFVLFAITMINVDEFEMKEVDLQDGCHKRYA